jgi:CRISPR-associated protein Cas6
MHVDLRFPVLGTTIPTDHSYGLFASLSHIIRAFHEADGSLRFATINGDRDVAGEIRITPRSRLLLRLSDERIRDVLCLAGRRLSIGGKRIRLGVPSVQLLRPYPCVAARMVTFKNAMELPRFLELARDRLDGLSIGGDVAVPLILSGPRGGEPRRRVLRIKNKRIVGFAMQVANLSPEQSLQIQEQGLGGRSHMGCGFFLPVPPGKETAC